MCYYRGRVALAAYAATSPNHASHMALPIGFAPFTGQKYVAYARALGCVALMNTLRYSAYEIPGASPSG